MSCGTAVNCAHRLCKACFAFHGTEQHGGAGAWLWCFLFHGQRLPALRGFDTPHGSALGALGLLPVGSCRLQRVAPQAWGELGWELLCWVWILYFFLLFPSHCHCWLRALYKLDSTRGQCDLAWERERAGEEMAQRARTDVMVLGDRGSWPGVGLSKGLGSSLSGTPALRREQLLCRC